MRNKKLSSFKVKTFSFGVVFKTTSFWRLGLRCYAPFTIKHWWWIKGMHMSHVRKKLLKKELK
jgi:hypothetical protein